MLVTAALLQSYFDQVNTLEAYLSEMIAPGPDGLPFKPNYQDCQAYHDLITSSWVCLKVSSEKRGIRQFQAFTPMMCMREIIYKALEKLFAKSKGRAASVLMFGYRPASNNGDKGPRGMMRLGITNYFVNTIVTALQARAWEELLQRIGADAMLYLLTETYMFISLPNNCLCQVTGEPIVNFPPPDIRLQRNLGLENAAIPIVTQAEKRKASGQFPEFRSSKRSKPLDPIVPIGSDIGKSKKVTKPADVSFVRTRLFYARPKRIPHTQIIVVGLPPDHILNKLQPSYMKKPKVPPEEYQDPDPRKQSEDVRCLAKYVFPRQYGLTNPFYGPSASKWESAMLPDYSDRQLEIKAKGPCRTPKRLKGILALLDQMIWKHGKCGYKPLRDIACPSKIKAHDSKPLDSSVILEMMSEYSIEMQSQLSFYHPEISVTSEERSIFMQGFSEAERNARSKPRFAEFTCSYVEVYRFAVLVTKAVIPNAFWGCKRNFKHIMGHVKDFITYRRFETISVHNILQGFSTSECDWLMPPGKAARKQARVSVTDSLKRRELLEQFIFWYFDSFLLPLLKTTFYVTESSAFRNRVLYFRQDDWEMLCTPLIEKLTQDTFQKIPESEAQEILRQRKLGFSFVRLLPKETGVRPIINLRRRKPRKGDAYSQRQSINQILQAAFHILTYEKKTRPELLGASVFGANEVYTKLKDFKSRLPISSTGRLPKLYFVKVDVKACFDTIEQAKLLHILRDLISEDAYMIQRYGQLTPVAGKAKRVFVKKAFPEDDHPHFLNYAVELAAVLKHSIFVDQVVYPIAKKQEILALLEEHITENIVKIGGDYYRQMVGIPQGSVLSAILCSFFYGDLEKRFFKYTEDPESVLLRWIDDYLFVTTDRAKAIGFLDMMYKGHPEYGCFISKEKTLTNFDYDLQIMNATLPMQKCFPWCGFLINMQDLSISVDYSRYEDTQLEDTLTIDRGRRPGSAFKYKMLRQVKTRIHIIFCDSALNRDYGVHLNMYQNFLLTAMKMHCYISRWKLNISKSSKFIQETIREIISYAYATIRNRSVNSCSRAHAGKCTVQKSAILWLGTHAFHVVLSRKPQAYLPLVKSLAFELSLAKNRRQRQRFHALVKEGLEGLSHISY